MYEAYWGLNDSPFRHTLDHAEFHAAPAQREAMARLQFAAERDIPLTILHGLGGAGRSFLLRSLQADLRASDRRVVQTNISVVDQHESLWGLAAALGGSPHYRESSTVLRQVILDHLRTDRWLGRTTVLIFDDADCAAEGIVSFLVRLARSADVNVVIIVSIESTRGRTLRTELSHLSPLYVPLDAWEHDETVEYLSSRLHRCGRSAQVFEPAASKRIWELSGGLPRWINHLAELCLVAGAVQKHASIDQAVVEAVFSEIQLSSQTPLARAA